jgi:hypothetical protein
MVAPINPTQLTPPRVDFIDPRSGAISREWYRFFLSLLTATQTNQQETELAPDASSLLAAYDTIFGSAIEGLESAPDAASASDLAVVQSEIQALSLTPAPLDALSVLAIIDDPSAPVTETADFTVAAAAVWVINNKSGSTCTVTLPSASAYPGRYITFQNYQNQFLVSASSNVVPRAGGAAGTAILDDVAGNWATLVSDGTNWVIMQASPFNVMLI